MRWLRFAVLILAATILQTSLTGIIAVTRANIKPDLLLILLVFFAVRCNSTDAVITSFAIGFAADLAGPTLGLMGPRTISFGLIGTLVSDLHNVISTRRVVYQAIAILLVGVLTAGEPCWLCSEPRRGVSLSVELLCSLSTRQFSARFLFAGGLVDGMNREPAARQKSPLEREGPPPPLNGLTTNDAFRMPEHESGPTTEGSRYSSAEPGAVFGVPAAAAQIQCSPTRRCTMRSRRSRSGGTRPGSSRPSEARSSTVTGRSRQRPGFRSTSIIG